MDSDDVNLFFPATAVSAVSAKDLSGISAITSWLIWPVHVLAKL